MKYNIIYIDPPWRFKNWSMNELETRGERWARANGRSPYPVLNTSTLGKLPIHEIADDNCVLFLWTTYPKLKEAFALVDDWNSKVSLKKDYFIYKTVAFTWVKTNPKGMRLQLEALKGARIDNFLNEDLVLEAGPDDWTLIDHNYVTGWHFGLGYWTRQNPELCLLFTKGRPQRTNNSVPNLVIAPRGTHSSKPPVVRERITDLMGELPRIELFARPPVPAGWDALGDEINGKDIREALEEVIQA